MFAYMAVIKKKISTYLVKEILISEYFNDQF